MHITKLTIEKMKDKYDDNSNGKLAVSQAGTYLWIHVEPKLNIGIGYFTKSM